MTFNLDTIFLSTGKLPKHCFKIGSLVFSIFFIFLLFLCFNAKLDEYKKTMELDFMRKFSFAQFCPKKDHNVFLK